MEESELCKLDTFELSSYKGLNMEETELYGSTTSEISSYKGFNTEKSELCKLDTFEISILGKLSHANWMSLTYRATQVQTREELSFYELDTFEISSYKGSDKERNEL